MKTVIASTFMALFMASTSHAVCMNKFSKEMNRYAADADKTVYKPAAVYKNGTSSAKVVAVNSSTTGRK